MSASRWGWVQKALRWITENVVWELLTIAWSKLAGLGIVTLVLSWLRIVPESWQVSFRTAAIVLFALSLLALFGRKSRGLSTPEDKSRSAKTPGEQRPPSVSQAPPMANPESVERLREIADPCLKSVRFAYEFFLAGIPKPDQPAEPISISLTRDLLGKYPGKDLNRALESVVDALIDRHQPWTEDFWGKTLIEIDQLLLHYIHFCGWLHRAGPILAGSTENYLNNSRFLELQKRHHALLDALRVAKVRTDINFVASRLGALERLFDTESVPILEPQRLAQPIRLRVRVEELQEPWNNRNPPETRMTFAHLKRKHLCLEVVNESARNIVGLVAKRRLSGQDEWITDPVWSKESGQDFTDGGNHRADLGAGDHRLLVVAQAFCADHQWARLLIPPSEYPMVSSDYNKSQNTFYETSGKPINLGTSVDLDLRLAADGIRTVDYKLRLTFIGDDPSVELSELPTDQQSPAQNRQAPTA